MKLVLVLLSHFKLQVTVMVPDKCLIKVEKALHLCNKIF